MENKKQKQSLEERYFDVYKKLQVSLKDIGNLARKRIILQEAIKRGEPSAKDAYLKVREDERVADFKYWNCRRLLYNYEGEYEYVFKKKDAYIYFDRYIQSRLNIDSMKGGEK